MAQSFYTSNSPKLFFCSGRVRSLTGLSLQWLAINLTELLLTYSRGWKPFQDAGWNATPVWRGLGSFCSTAAAWVVVPPPLFPALSCSLAGTWAQLPGRQELSQGWAAGNYVHVAATSPWLPLLIYCCLSLHHTTYPWLQWLLSSPLAGSCTCTSAGEQGTGRCNSNEGVA